MAVRHCISRGSSDRVRVRVRAAPIGKQCFIPPWHLAGRAAGYQDRPSPVNNQIRGARKSLLLAQKVPMARLAKGQGTRDSGYPTNAPGTRYPGMSPVERTANSRGSALLASDIRAQVFERDARERRIRRSFALRKEFTSVTRTALNQEIQYFSHTLSCYVSFL